MDCIYCPRWSSMEDYSPMGLETPGLSKDEYLKILINLAKSITFSSISFTGGEPLTNKYLSEIAKAVRPYTLRLELNTNGILLNEKKWEELKPYFNRVKISMDSIDNDEFNKITNLHLKDGLERVQKSIRLVRDSGVEVAVNTVVMKSNIDSINKIIDWCQTEKVRLHLLDFYYTDERKTIWKDEFIALENIIPELNSAYGHPQVEEAFGCKFLTYNFSENKSIVRLKTSYSGTMRSNRCSNCAHYCQEGIYGLKLSQKGWVTTCPSNLVEDGTLISPDWDIEKVKTSLKWLVNDIQSAIPEHNSFEQFLKKNQL